MSPLPVSGEPLYRRLPALSIYNSRSLRSGSPSLHIKHKEKQTEKALQLDLHLTRGAEHGGLVANGTNAGTHALGDEFGTTRAGLVAELELGVLPHDRSVHRSMARMRGRARIEAGQVHRDKDDLGVGGASHVLHALERPDLHRRRGTQNLHSRAGQRNCRAD